MWIFKLILWSGGMYTVLFGGLIGLIALIVEPIAGIAVLALVFAIARKL